jgi:mono/diheme cytochrome c family protein
MEHRSTAVWLARVGLAVLALAGIAQPVRAADAARGRAVYVSICSSCHGFNGIGNLEYVPSFSKCEGLDKDNATLRISVRDGIGGRMPAWGVYLSEREIEDAIAYARTFCRR